MRVSQNAGACVAFAPDLNCLLTIDAHRRSVSTRTSLIEFSCRSCAQRTPTTLEWASEYGVTCEGCFEKIPLDVVELGQSLAAINMAWDEVDSVARDLRRPLTPASAAATG